MPYVDGFVLAVPKDNVEAYKDLARRAGEVWMEYGALTYVECAGDDVPEGETTSFPMAVKARADVDHLRLEGKPGRDRRQGHGRPAPAGGRVGHAVRRQADDLRRLRPCRDVLTYSAPRPRTFFRNWTSVARTCSWLAFLCTPWPSSRASTYQTSVPCSRSLATICSDSLCGTRGSLAP